MPAIHEPMCRIGTAVQVHQHHRTMFTTYVKDIFCVMENPILNEHKNKSSRNNPLSSASTAAATATQASVNSKVCPKPKFLKLLQSVGAKGKAFQVSEIINYLKEYISSKQLFDQQKPWVVHCENDYLGAVFHCKQFTIDDVRGLLNQNVTVCKSDSIDDDEDESFDSDATEILVSSMSDSDHGPPKKTTPLDDIISSSTSESPKPIFSSTDPLLRVNSSFLEILQDVGAKGEVFREKEIFKHLKNYVWSRRLFDPSHPWICLCQNDKLANVFRCDKFLINDVPHLVAKFGLEYPEYRPKVIRSSSDLPPKTASAVALPLHSHVSAPGRTQSTPSDITSSTIDVITLTSSDHIEEQTSHRSWNSESATMSHKSEESGSVLPHSSKESRSTSSSRSKESGSAASFTKSEEGGKSATLSLSQETGSSSVCSFSQESEHPASSSRSTNSFTLTVEMQDNNEVLSFQSEEPVDDVYVEYEVMSTSPSFHMSDSEDEHHKVSMDMLVICQDSDVDCYADYSDTGSDTDVELSEADKWCCSNCHLYNSPIHRLCDRCWTLRPDWLPDREKQTSHKTEDSNVEKHKAGPKQIRNQKSLEKLRSKGNGSNSSEGEDEEEEDKISSSDDDDDQHSDNLNRSSRPPTPFDELENTRVKDNSCNDTLDLRTTLSNICHFTESEIPARRTRNQTRNLKRNLISDSDDTDYCSKFPKMSSPVKSLVAPGLCIICLHNPRDASLIHGASGHQICCLTCAKKLKQKGSKCPVCRRTIQKVVRNYLT